MRRPGAELAIAVAAAAVGAAALLGMVAASGFDARSSVAPGIGPPWAAAMLAIAVGAHLAQRRPGHGRLLVAALAGVGAAVAMVPLMAGLHGTDQPPFSIAHGDMLFRTEYVTRFASTWHLDDYTFRGLHAFYPPAWFWAAGRTAALLGVTPWKIVGPFEIATIGVALLVAYGLWRVALRPAGALSAAIGSLLVLPAQAGPLRPPLQFTTQGWYSSYSCFVAVTGIAWVAAMLHTVRRPAPRGRLAVLALAGAVLALTYYLLFVLLALVLVALAAGARPGRRDRMLRLGAVLGGVALLTAVFWVPLLFAILGGAASQGHFVAPAFLRVSVGIGRPVALAVLAAVALGALVMTLRVSLASRVVAGLLAGAVAYQLLSVLTLVLFHDQLQPHRAVTLLWAAYGAAVPVAYEALRRRGPVALVVVALALPAAFALGAAQGSDLASGPLARAAHVQPDVAGADAISRFIAQTMGKGPDGLTIVSGNRLLLATHPYFGFLPLRARYAHPKAKVPERIAALRVAAACRDAACATGALTATGFGPVDALVLGRTPAGYRVRTDEDGFPAPRPVTITFRPGLFDPGVWARRDFGGYVVLVRRG
ncbi:MAG: galactan 5-O-arabinofuranosyltransferase [Thermoleophilaceae bacterium]|nr:galactan 5-O-arabinofuranosyltransferase [Thermoleophilaceae bacterium]